VTATPPPFTVGLDLSLTSTGLGRLTGGTLTTARFRTKPGTFQRDDDRAERADTLGRYRRIAAACCEWATDAALVVVEGPSLHSKGSAFHQLAGLWWYVLDALDAAGQTWLVVDPSTLKVYATGKGNAGKDDMLAAAIRRLGWAGSGNDEADAAWLAAFGADLLGAPLVDLPQSHRRALDKVRRPIPGVAA
jgi:hypothetical protein